MANEKKTIRNFKWFDYKVIGTVLIIKFLILGFAYQSYMVVTDQPIQGAYEFLGMWKRWDAVHYVSISELGYTAVGEHRFMIVFFPFYPLLIAAFSVIIGDNLVSAFIVSGLASVALGLVFRELVKLDYSERIAQFAVFFLFIFPTSFVLHIPYTESLFLALTVGCFLAARKRSWILAGILGGLACLTRINGLILFPALLFEVWNEYDETKQFNRKWFCLAMIPFGFTAYLALNYFVTGNPTMFLVHQREHWNKYLDVPWHGIWEAFKSTIYRKPSESIMIGFQESLFVLIGLFATIAGWRHLRGSYRVWMIANWLLFVSTSFILSVPRYTLVLFPLFILMAVQAVRNWWANVLFIVWSILFLSLFTTQFIRGWWAF
ncbi:MAG TPA: glycosyltransferase family 39 protein [Pyrinomonadaceae bacterium]|nr:glycosyltransferase family 39 protein [Pyrinomonadaceae bacterium]